MSRAVALFVASLACGCAPDVVVGSWTCAKSRAPAGPVDDAGTTAPVTDPVEVPWSTGFEDAFCGYNAAKGWCYAHAGASYASVLGPVHSGRRAAAFSLDTADADAGDGADSRCVREGTLPRDAYYGAWFYLPALPEKTDNWNLMHFQGGNGDANGWNNLWDVTLAPTADGGFGLTIVADMKTTTPLDPQDPPAVPVASWFHVVFRFVRATDTSGEITLYENDQPLRDVKGIVTDTYAYDQWYVGNLVNTATPSALTVYVDDVSISSTNP